MLETEKLKNLENSSDYCDLADAIDDMFKEDPILKIEMPKTDSFENWISMTYTDDRGSMNNIYINRFPQSKLTLISHIFPYCYKNSESFSGYNKMTRIVIDHNGKGNIVHAFSDRIINTGKKDSFGKPMYISEPSKKPQGKDQRIQDILDRTEQCFLLINALIYLPEVYRKERTGFRGNLKDRWNGREYLATLEKIKRIKDGKLSIEYIDLTGISPEQRPRFNHPPYVVFD